MVGSQAPKRGRPPLKAPQVAKMQAIVMTAAQDLFAKEGYSAISMRRLAKQVGCSPMTLYTYYAGKIDILHGLWSVVFSEVFAKIENGTVRDAPPSERLRQAARAYVHYWLLHPEHYRMVFMSEQVSQPEVTAFLADPKTLAGFAILLAPLSEALDPATPADQLKLKADLMMCGLQGIAHTLVTVSGHSWSSADDLVDAMIDCCLASFRHVHPWVRPSQHGSGS
ncbi:MAG: AcrR family transcriptional regulator [Paracoccaceae bacterium]|jgi:AcrR family transcriptional regulator